MKKSIVLLVLMGVCLVSLVAGFVLGQFSFLAVNQGVQIETGRMNMIVFFKPEANEKNDKLIKEVGVASLSLYSEALTACLNEPENLEKINSMEILANFVAGSCLVNAMRPRVKDKQEKSEKKSSDYKRNL
jgi:hypothetical protein